jgi:hypothetical protein
MNVRPWWLLPPGRIHPGWWIASARCWSGWTTRPVLTPHFPWSTRCR